MIKKMARCLVLFFTLISFNVIAKDYYVGFYSDFEPISYSVSRDPSSPEFNSPRGYEVDLLKAMQAIPHSEMTFKFHAIKAWDNIWLAPVTNPKMDIVIGGITREDRRLLDDNGKVVVAVTHKTASFKQSLLVKTKNATAIKSHQDLTCAYLIGAVKATTGEYRYLVQTRMINNLEQGLIKKGITVILEDKHYIISDGNLSIYDPKISTRTMLLPPNCSMPLTRYFVAEDSMIPALLADDIDGIARGYIGNKFVADKSNGTLTVTAIYSLECPHETVTCNNKEEAVFFVKKNDTQLLAQLNKYIDYLTDNGKIDYDQWAKNNNIFMERAKAYKP